MLDGHIHIERGAYTLDWINQFVSKAVEMEIDEICYFKEFERFISGLTKGKGFDFLLGSIHFVDDFAFDHKAEHWTGLDVDKIFGRYFEDSISLAKSRIFDGIGHPDAIRLFGHGPSYSLSGYYESLA